MLKVGPVSVMVLFEIKMCRAFDPVRYVKLFEKYFMFEVNYSIMRPLVCAAQFWNTHWSIANDQL